MPGDPAMAAVLEEAMAEEFAATVADKGTVKNSTDANGAEHAEKGSGNGGQFVGKDGGASKSADGKSQDQPRETNYERRKRTCKEALDKYNASTDHPSADDVANGKIPVREALKKGFSETFGGRKLLFFTEEKLTGKYTDRGEGWKIDLIPEMLVKKGKMQPKPHSGDQTVFIESRSKENAGKRKLVAIADAETGVVVHIGRESEKYISDHYKK